MSGEKIIRGLEEALAAAKAHVDAMTPEERETMREAQRKSWVRAMTTGCEHGVLDFEQCPDCRSPRSTVPHERH